MDYRRSIATRLVQVLMFAVLLWAFGMVVSAQTESGADKGAPQVPDSFSDVRPSDYFYAAVQQLVADGAISGYSDGTFRPYNMTTRAQLCKIVVLTKDWAINTTGGPHFSDVPPSHPFYSYIETAFYREVVSGYAGGTFRPNALVTRSQLCKIVVLSEQWDINTAGGPHFTDVPASDPLYSFVETAVNRGVIVGYADRTFRPRANATRGQVCKIVYQASILP